MRPNSTLCFVFLSLVGSTACAPDSVDSTLQQSESGSIAARVLGNNVSKVYRGTPSGARVTRAGIQCYVFGPTKAGDVLDVQDEVQVYFGENLIDALFSPDGSPETDRSFGIHLDELKRDQLIGRVTRLKAYNEYSETQAYIDFDPNQSDRLLSVERNYLHESSRQLSVACGNLQEIQPTEVAKAYQEFMAPFPGEVVDANNALPAFETQCLIKAQDAIEKWLNWNTEEGFWGRAEIGGGFHRISYVKNGNSSDQKISWYIEFQYSTAVADAYGTLGTWAVETKKDGSGGCVVEGDAKLKRRQDGFAAERARRQ